MISSTLMRNGGSEINDLPMECFRGSARSDSRLRAGRRPVLVVSREPLNQLLSVVNVVPLTSVKSPDRALYPNEALLPAQTGGLPVDSIALCYQVRTLDKSRFEKHLGELTDSKLKDQIQIAMR